VASRGRPAALRSAAASVNAVRTAGLAVSRVLGVFTGLAGSNGVRHTSFTVARCWTNRWNNSDPRLSTVNRPSHAANAAHAEDMSGSDEHMLAVSAAASRATRLTSENTVCCMVDSENPLPGNPSVPARRLPMDSSPSCVRNERAAPVSPTPRDSR